MKKLYESFLTAALFAIAGFGVLSVSANHIADTDNHADKAKNSNKHKTRVTGNKINVALPPAAPVISYTSPLTYTNSVTIAALSPTNAGGAVPLNPYAQVSTFAGSITHGSANGTGTAASFYAPAGTAIDATGNIYVVDEANSLIRKITPAGVVTTVAGSGERGSANGTGTAASFSNPYGIAVDATGNIYVADFGNHLIRKITPAGVVSTFAGSGSPGSLNGTGTAASFSNPIAVAVDNGGNVYVADFGNHKIRKITQAGVVSTFAGSGGYGNTDGPGILATFTYTYGVAVDGAGIVYVADIDNNAIRKITPDGVVSTFVGGGLAGSADGTGAAARFNGPRGVAAGINGSIYVSDGAGNTIREVTPSGQVSTLAGIGTLGFTNGIGRAAKFNVPFGLSADAAGNLYVADVGNNMIRKITTTGYSISPALTNGLSFNASTGVITGTPTVTAAGANYTIRAYNTGGSSTFTLKITVKSNVAAPVISYTSPVSFTKGVAIAALSPTNTGGAVPATTAAQVTTLAGSGSVGSANGTGTAATFRTPTGTATDAAGNIYVAEYGNSLIRKITPGGAVSTFAGSGAADFANGTGTAAAFKNPFGLAVDTSGNVFVADYNNHLIRKITPQGAVTTVAGNLIGGLVNGTGSAARFNHPIAIAVDNWGDLYVADWRNNVIRKITPAGVVSTLAGSGVVGATNGTGTAATFARPYGVAVDGTGMVYVADFGNNLIRKITPAGVVSTFAGSGAAGSADGLGVAASFNGPRGIATGANGSLYVSDGTGNKIREIKSSGQVSTLAGSGTAGFVNGVGTAAKFSGPFGLSADVAGNIYVADASNNVIRKIVTTGYTVTPALPAGLSLNTSTGVITGTPIVAAAAKNYTITAYNAGGSSTFTLNITVAATGPAPVISYISPLTYTNGVPIAALSPANTGGAVPANPYAQVSTFAGSATHGSADGTGTAASFFVPAGTAIDAAGNVYVADKGNNLIRKITPAGIVSTFAGNGSYGRVNGIGTAASFANPYGLATDAAGNLYIADTYNSLIRKITPMGEVSTIAGTGSPGSANGIGTAASFNNPIAIAVDNAGNLYVADFGNRNIRKITPDGAVSTFAGSGGYGATNGPGTTATFSNPYGVTVDDAGMVYVADHGNNLIRKITPAGVVSTFAGSGAAGSADGTGIAASFNGPLGVVIGANGSIYVSEATGNTIREIKASGQVTTLAGYGAVGFLNSIGTAAKFNVPFGLSADAAGNLYVADVGNNMIRKITTTGYSISPALTNGLSFNASTGVITGTPTVTAAGANYIITAYNTGGSSTFTLKITVKSNVAAPVISYTSPVSFTKGVAIAALSPTNTGGAVPATTVAQVTTLAGSGSVGSANGTGTAATFRTPTGTATDAAGNIYVAEYGNSLIRKITPGGVVSTLAGSGTQGTANGTGTAASFENPYGLAVDTGGNVFVADYGDNLIRKITPEGVVTYFAGNVTAGLVNGTGTAAHFNHPIAIAVDDGGDLYVADWGNNVIRKITPAGVVSTFAGSGAVGATNGTGTAVTFARPYGVAVDGTGVVYVADFGNNLIRKITPAGVVSTFAGSGAAGSADGLGTAASFNSPRGIAIGANGSLYVSDGTGNKIREIKSSGQVSTLAGSGTAGFVNGAGSAVKFSGPFGLSTDVAGNIYVADASNNVIRKIVTTGYTITPALPAGLSLNTSTGVITGTPTITSPATNYTVMAYNSGGNSSTVINITINEQSLFMANSLQETPIATEPIVKQALSPNGDGNNDVLIIENIEQYPDNKLVIMSVNGAKIYEASGYGTGNKVFNGHSDVTGKLQLAGTYFYQLEYRTAQGVKRKRGYFVIKY